MPTITAIFPTFGPPSGGNSVIITGTGFTGPTSVYFGGTATTFTLDNPTQITALAPPGSGTVQVTVVNAGGVSNGVAYTYGAPPLPTLTAIVPTSGPATGGTVVVLTGTNLTGTTAVTFGATPATSFTVNSATQITAIAPAGAGTVAVTVTTAAGTSNALGYTYIAVPTILALSPATGPATGGNAVIITGTGFTGATAVTFGATPAAGFTVDSATQITAIAPAGGPGAVGVTVTTPGGTSGAALYTYLAAPTITTLLPAVGPEAGGNAVVILGSGFTGATAVTFGATPAAFIVDSPTQITVTAPPGVGLVGVTVTTPGGTGGPALYTYLAVPAITTLFPISGPEAGGTVVIITGTGFTGATAVTFGATPAAGFTVDSATQITATAPPGVGAVGVTVTTPGGTSGPVVYTYIPVPVIATILPPSGPEAGGNVVAIGGTGFTGATAITFGLTPAAAFTVVSDILITATVPAGVGTVGVTVTTVGGISLPALYTYLALPTVLGLSPISGPEGGGTAVIITGSGFTGATAVTFGITPAAGFTVDSDTQITATSPAGVGVVGVTVTTAGGISIPALYTYVPVPVIAVIAPPAGPAAGGTPVVISGTGFTGASSVTFGGLAAAFIVTSDSSITATTPAHPAGAVAVGVTTVGGTDSLPASFTYV
ncbi:beta strand repeat-containing protein [Nocardia sp. 004]|uniref:beta strand repeat-containing protein n=1 Tax=Nocardia sp. 004 TaxID=3385978 RepID=UPI00399FE831